MTLQLIDISVRDRQAHPRLAGRVTGHVRAVLSETLGSTEQTHDLAIPVWADVSADASDADIEMAMMLKAADIIARLKANIERPDAG
ncbi:hypothetical protein [Devosia psychrophila]|jgi:hypothetical protein|uniref:Uncharacterized protein n=1 Tax=Devosia psychrophila TaxID=728005 RepID=A0A0F5PSB7_9HYPH|nr:hypothetical protein [Devosia psychrophila]KKC31510.1 hypothetical protein WH91_18935 [Devosia psychrophila]SFB98429.1 hypothetical protein SAMN04488059_101264 [Devosia psychrophila]